MNSSELTALISVFSIAIADLVPDNSELGLLATIFTQLGDTLDTIATRREMESSF